MLMFRGRSCTQCVIDYLMATTRLILKWFGKRYVMTCRRFSNWSRQQKIHTKIEWRRLWACDFPVFLLSALIRTLRPGRPVPSCLAVVPGAHTIRKVTLMSHAYSPEHPVSLFRTNLNLTISPTRYYSTEECASSLCWYSNLNGNIHRTIKTPTC